MALPVEIVFVTSFSLEGLRNSPVAEVEEKATSTVSVEFAEALEESWSWIVIVPEISPGLIVCGSVVKEICETTAEAKRGKARRPSIDKT